MPRYIFLTIPPTGVLIVGGCSFKASSVDREERSDLSCKKEKSHQIIPTTVLLSRIRFRASQERQETTAPYFNLCERSPLCEALDLVDLAVSFPPPRCDRLDRLDRVDLLETPPTPSSSSRTVSRLPGDVASIGTGLLMGDLDQDVTHHNVIIFPRRDDAINRCKLPPLTVRDFYKYLSERWVARFRAPCVSEGGPPWLCPIIQPTKGVVEMRLTAEGNKKHHMYMLFGWEVRSDLPSSVQLVLMG